MSIILGDIQQAYYTAAQWSSWNGILLAGQKGIESDTLKEKVGDGVTVWNSLSYSSVPAQNLQNVLSIGSATGGLGYNITLTTGDVLYIGNNTRSIYSPALGTAGITLDNTNSSEYIVLKDSGGVSFSGTTVTMAQLGYLNGVTSSIQTQLNNKQPLDVDLTSWAGVTRAAGFDTFATTPSSANLASLVTGETGSGALVFGTSPTFTTDITTPKINGVSGNLLFANAVQTSGAITNFTFTGSSNTGQTASVNIPTWQVNGVTQTRAAGTVATQYFNYWKANTLAFASASTATNVYANFFETSLEGTAATFSNNYAIGTDGNIYARSAVNTRIIVSTTGTTSRAAFETEDDLGNVSRFATYGSAFSLTHFRGNGVLQATNDLYLIPSVGSSTGGTKSIYFLAGGNAASNQRLLIDSNGNTVQGTAALATNATNGFLYIETCAGTPTGVPTTYTGRIAMVYDTTNNKLYMYNGAWKSVTLA